MSNIAAKTASNIFYQARCKASTHNEQLSNREGAADLMSIDRGRIYRIESGVADPYPEEVHLMADLYNAPELRNYYCTEICPLGCDMPKVGAVDLDRITIRALSSFKKISQTEDGIISDDERPAMQKVLENLGELEAIAQNLKVWVKKNL